MSKTRARTAAQKRRDKRKARQATITLAGGLKAPQRPTGRDRRHTNQQEDDPMQTAIQARMRHTGLTADRARLDMAGCAVGRRLLTDRISDAEDLWQAVRHLRSVIITYDRAVRAPNRHAQCLRIMAPTDTMHADASSPPPDERTPEERDRQAVTAYMALQGWLSHADGAARSACLRHVVDEPDEPVRDWSGIVLALRCVSDGIKGQKLQWRGRG
ncbi:hypothetical protein [Roseinatronobacter alkalisoli]|uniref:Uncharacterized protein n=1 Tax=Roseinatronobacter alkalisoli TaxID=3028235 RepID=A0ABT5TE99_9RHOB|nr:hypothetical protein [Roseinatronobacter sp. HJB301]MDD7973433.1 hypothetical protein [Roseinatronobacter sp. HJB301]